jgi:hypothetical protein
MLVEVFMQIDSVQPEKPLIPEPTPENETPTPPSAYPESLKSIFRNHQNLQWEIHTGFHSGPTGRRKGYKLAMWSLTASLIDLFLLLGMSCVFLLVFLKIIRMPITESLMQDFSVVFIAGLWMYMVTTRFFIGSSLGEAACDLRLGRPQDRMSSRYFLKVIARATLIIATGIFILPLLSLIFGRDLAGSLSGVKLFSLV